MGAWHYHALVRFEHQTCVVYTSLVNINREDNDGRSIHTYINWLSQTCQIFPNLVVFHDGCLNGVSLNKSTLFLINLSEFESYKFLKHVSTVIKNGKFSASNDITFTNAYYSLIQYLKFELASYVINNFDCDSVLWVDAGISRFMTKISNGLEISNNSHYLIEHGYKLRLEVAIRHNFSFKKLAFSESPIGSCRRVISGTSFWISKDTVAPLENMIFIEMRKWEKLGVWDNEQVMLRNLEPWLKFKTFFDGQNFHQTGSVARNMSKKIGLTKNAESTLINFFLERS